MVWTRSRRSAVAACRTGDGDPEAGEEIGVDYGTELGWEGGEMGADGGKTVTEGSVKAHRPGC